MAKHLKILRHSSCVLLALFVLAALSNRTLNAEDAPDSAETKEAAEEDEAEKKLPETEQIQALKTVRGVLKLGAAEDNSEVVGTLTAESGDSYLLKLASKDLAKRLERYNNKNVTLTGKLRNKGKYLIVQNISDAAGGSSERTKRGGI
jgi:hypothetical protein